MKVWKREFIFRPNRKLIATSIKVDKRQQDHRYHHKLDTDELSSLPSACNCLLMENFSVKSIFSWMKNFHMWITGGKREEKSHILCATWVVRASCEELRNEKCSLIVQCHQFLTKPRQKLNEERNEEKAIQSQGFRCWRRARDSGGLTTCFGIRQRS